MKPETKHIDYSDDSTPNYINVWSSILGNNILWWLNGASDRTSATTYDNTRYFPNIYQGAAEGQIIGTEFVSLWADLRFFISPSEGPDLTIAKVLNSMIRISLVSPKGNTNMGITEFVGRPQLPHPTVANKPDFMFPWDYKFWTVHYDKIIRADTQTAYELAATSMDSTGVRFFRFRIPLKMKVATIDRDSLGRPNIQFPTDMLMYVGSSVSNNNFNFNRLSIRYYYKDP